MGRQVVGCDTKRGAVRKNEKRFIYTYTVHAHRVLCVAVAAAGKLSIIWDKR